jgi:GNAT superfamily N-acetyltransferase
VVLPHGCELSVEDRPSPADRGRLDRGLGRFNREVLDKPQWARLGVFVRDRQRRQLLGGLAGHTYAGWMFIESLWVHDDWRRRGVGRELIASAERRAVERGCHSAYVDTFSFQAPEFYRKLGYREFGRLNYPPHTRIFLQKRLAPE